MEPIGEQIEHQTRNTEHPIWLPTFKKMLMQQMPNTLLH